MESKIYTYSSAWSHAYSCLHGGVGQFNPLRLGKRNHTSIGTRRFGCTAVVHIRHLDVSNGMKILEIQIPTISAHLSAHDPSSVTDQLTMTPLQQIEEKVVDLVQECFLNYRALRLSLKTWVEKKLIPKHLNQGAITSKPSEENRAYYPTREDVRVIIQKAITQEHNSLLWCIDSIILTLCIHCSICVCIVLSIIIINLLSAHAQCVLCLVSGCELSKFPPQ